VLGNTHYEHLTKLLETLDVELELELTRSC
jgi:hypothetical protein